MSTDQTDPRSAVRSMLASYLTAQLADVAGLTVNEQWPIPQQQLATPAITIVTSPQLKCEYHLPRLWTTTPTIGVNGIARYSYGRAELNLQIDVWSDYEATRDALAARAESVLNRDPLETLAPNPSRPVGYARKPGLVLALTNYHNTPCEFIFETPASSVGESKGQAMVADWRNTFAGRAILHLMNEEVVALMKSVTMKLAINGYASQDISLT